MADSLDGSALVANSVTETQLVSTFTNKVTNAYTSANLAYAKANTGLSASGNTTITGNLTFSVGGSVIFGSGSVLYANSTIESPNVSVVSLGANINFDVLNQSILYLTTNSTANGTINFRGNSISSFENFLATGKSFTSALLVTNGSTAYAANTVQIDSVTQTVKWAGGTPPTTGNPNSIDLYSFTIIKTAPLTYTVLASQQKYA